MKIFTWIVLLPLIFLKFSTIAFGQSVRLYAGTYTKKESKGLFLLDVNLSQGIFRVLSETEAGQDPSYFCISKKKGLIYAANEVMEFNGNKGGGVTTLRYDDKTAAVTKVNELLVPKGGPCFISLSPAEDFLLFASYSSASIAVVRLDQEGIPQKITDTISFAPAVGKISHPHMISFDPSGKKVYLTDLGLDRIIIYDFDSVKGTLRQTINGIIKFPDGTGPRHFVFNKPGSKMYVICELNSTISVFDVGKNGELTKIQMLSALDEGFKGESYCADIHIGNSGEYIYGSNRGENTIVVFRTGNDGRLSLQGRVSCGGNWPRNFVIDPSGKYLIVGNQNSGNIALFKINEKTGLPVETGKGYSLNAPACLKF